MAKWVIDANVAIKWVLPEVYSNRALSLLDNDQDEFLVPDFFFSEITNILWKLSRFRLSGIFPTFDDEGECALK
ncbi:type II toxin-antitoxin system VapC family toxin [Sphaerothrix gracilis]|uniref:type II toxin-antitoxin system VapC family toxin n=1 Tax=Sphaerothrix gracilis TaxID=3151835 RepID=UPI0031FBCFE7